MEVEDDKTEFRSRGLVLTWPGIIPLREVLVVAKGLGASSYSITHPPPPSDVTSAALYWGATKNQKKIKNVKESLKVGDTKPSKWSPVEGKVKKKNSVLKALQLIADEHALPWSSGAGAAAVGAAAAGGWPKAGHLLQSDDLKDKGEALLDKVRNAGSPLEAVIAGGRQPTVSMLVKIWTESNQRKKAAMPELAVGHRADSFKKPEELGPKFAKYITDKEYKKKCLEFRGEPGIGKSAYIRRMLEMWGFKNPFMVSSSFQADFYSHGHGHAARFKPGVHDAIVHDDCTLPANWDFSNVKKYLDVEGESSLPSLKIGNAVWNPVNIPAGVPKMFLLNYEDPPVASGLMVDGGKIIDSTAVLDRRLVQVFLPKTFTKENPLYILRGGASL